MLFLLRWSSIYIKAFLMGFADLIPGFSGGTIAYVTGIYPRLIHAISKIDTVLFKHIIHLRLRAALIHCDAAFLITILLGVISAIFIFTKALNIPAIIEAHTVIFYRICLLLMVIVMFQLIKETLPRSTRDYGLITLGICAGYLLTHGEPQYWSDSPEIFFLCGAIAITAMILPGISGSFLLVALGKYVPLLEAVRENDYIIIASFALGATIGIIATSKLLNALLKHYEVPVKHWINGFIMGCTLLLMHYAALT